MADGRHFENGFFSLYLSRESFIHLFCKKQLTERNCTIKLENWLKYYNSSSTFDEICVQMQILIPRVGT